MRRGTGRWGEEQAARYLERKGYRVLERNYLTRQGEIDLVCEKNGLLVFVEVRTRSSERFGSPEESVTAGKISRLRRTALHYLQVHGASRGFRFDVVAVRLTDGRPTFNHIEGAF